jgi:hypothetical protein
VGWFQNKSQNFSALLVAGLINLNTQEENPLLEDVFP